MRDEHMKIEDIRTKEHFEGKYLFDERWIVIHNDFRLRLGFSFKTSPNGFSYLKKHQHGVFRVTGDYYSARNCDQITSYDQFMEIIHIQRADCGVLFREIPNNFAMIKLLKRSKYDKGLIKEF